MSKLDNILSSLTFWTLGLEPEDTTEKVEDNAKDRIKLLFLDLIIESSDTDAAKMIESLRTKIGEL